LSGETLLNTPWPTILPGSCGVGSRSAQGVEEGDRAGEQPDEPAGRSIQDTTPLPNTNKPLSLKSWSFRSPTEEDRDAIALEAGCRDVGFSILVDVPHRHVVGAEPDRER
jgi:hypothetical protein